MLKKTFAIVVLLFVAACTGPVMGMGSCKCMQECCKEACCCTGDDHMGHCPMKDKATHDHKN